MVDLFGLDTSVWTALAASVQTFIFAAAAGFAYRQVREARLTREDQTRPFVVMDFDMSEPPLIHLVIANIGKTMARRIRIETDPPLASSLDRDDDLGYIAKLRLFTDEIPSLAPGRQIRLLFDSFPQREDGKFDDVYQVKITYEGERRRAWRRDRPRPYDDDSVLDLGIYRNIQYVDRKTIHDVHKEVKKIADAARSWGAGLGSGILVVSRGDRRKDRALALRHFRARQQGGPGPREASETTVRWRLRRLRERASRVLASRLRRSIQRDSWTSRSPLTRRRADRFGSNSWASRNAVLAHRVGHGRYPALDYFLATGWVCRQASLCGTRPAEPWHAEG